MRQRVLGLALAMIGCFALVSASGAATTNAQKVTTINVSTRAAVVHYLRSIHVNAKHAVIQRGGLNYAGARCPAHWACASTKHTVVQIAKPGGLNRFVCRRAHCVVVQFSGTEHGVYLVGRQAAVAAPTKPSPGGSTVACVKTGSGATTGTGQSCVISQLGSGPNTAGVYENTTKISGLVQTAQYAASITQQSTGSNNNTACVTQNINLDGSTTNTNGKPTTANLQGHQSIQISQDNSGLGAGTQRATNSAQYAATSTGGCDTSSSLTQSQTLSSTVTATGPITQQEDAFYNPCGDGFTGDYANLCLKIDQNQTSNQTYNYKCRTVSNVQTCGSSAANVATFTQNSTQTAVANANKGAAVSQQQSTPPCSTQSAPTNAPADCVAPSGLIGTINQDSSGVSTASPTQNETQCEDAAISGLSSCSHTPDPPPSGVTQSQYGPVGVGNLVHTSPHGPVGFGHLKGLGQALQHGNSADQYTINQYSTQYADVGAFQQNFGKADCTTDGFCTAAQTTTINGASTSDGYTAPTIPNLNITCTGNSACVPTPPPDPSLTGSPTLVNGKTTSRSPTFTFTDTANDAQFICILDGTVQPSPTCGSPTVVQGKASGSQSYTNLSYGTHTFQVKAVDQSGNKSAAIPTSAFTWTIVPPDPTIDTKPQDPATYGSSTFTFSDTGSDVDFKCQIDNQAATWCNSGSITYSGATVLSSGQHTFNVRAYDSATDSVPSVNAATYSWVITPPTPSVSSGPGGTDHQTTSTDANFTFADADPTVTFLCKLDDAADYTACPGTNPMYSSLPHGVHTLDVKAIDQAGDLDNLSTGFASYSWEVIPYVTFEVSDPDFGATAGWSGTPGSSPITLHTGTDDGTYAQFTIHDRSDLTVSDLAQDEPTFTPDSYVGSPRYEIDLDNGDYLFGYPPEAGFGSNSWDINCGGSNLGCTDQAFVTWADVQSAEGSATITDVLIEADFPTDFTYSISDFSFDGYHRGDVAP